MRKWFAVIFMILIAFGCVGCGREEVVLTLWVAEEDIPMVSEEVDAFVAQYSEEADIRVKIEPESAAGVKGIVLNDVGLAADVYNFASDQFYDLYNGKALAQIDYKKEETIEDNGGFDEDVVDSVMVDGNLYAYPMTTGNGFFLYYDGSFFTEQEVEKLSDILDKAAEENKYFAMDWNSGWYMYSFFGGAGKTVVFDPVTNKNVCDFNSSDGAYSGVQIAQAMLDIAEHKGFQSVANDSIMSMVETGEVVAFVSGTWDATAVEEIWGSNCKAVKLPTYNIEGDEVQMASFHGCKYLGVNPNSEHYEWAQKLAQWLTSEEQQMKRFEVIGECPSNVKVMQHEKIQASSSISAMIAQSEFADIQNVGDNYWEPMSKLGVYLISGNLDEKDMQEILDDLVEDIEE